MRVALSVAVVLLVIGCGGDDDDGAARAPTTAAASGEVPWLGDLEGSKLEPGTYASIRFPPRFELTLGDGWQVPEGNAPNLVILAFGQGDLEELPFLVFVGPKQVYQPSGSGALEPGPEDLVAWLRAHPHVTVGEVTPATVGGAPAEEFDIRVRSLPPQNVDCFGGPCVPLFAIKDGKSPPYALSPDVAVRMIVVDVEGDQLVIGMETQPADLEEFVPRAHAVLETVRFR